MTAISSAVPVHFLRSLLLEGQCGNLVLHCVTSQAVRILEKVNCVLQMAVSCHASLECKASIYSPPRLEWPVDRSLAPYLQSLHWTDSLSWRSPGSLIVSRMKNIEEWYYCDPQARRRSNALVVRPRVPKSKRD